MGRFVSRTIALFIVLLFIVTASISACTSAFRISLIDVDTYKQTLVEQKVYQDIIPYVIPVMLENAQEQLSADERFVIDLNDIDRFMTVDDWRRVSDQLIPPEWLRTQTESLLDSLNSITRGDFSQRENVIELSEIIDRLQGEAANQASEIIITSAPACTAQQVIQLRQFDGETGSVFPVCNPPALQRDKATGVIETWFNRIGTAIGLQMRQENKTLSIPEEVASIVYNLFQLDLQLSLLLLLCPLSLVGLIILFAVRTLKSFGRWLGWTFILSGILTLVLIFTSQAPVFATFDEVFSASTEIERFEAQIYAGFVRSVYTDASTTMLIIAGAMIAGGFVLLVVSMFSRSNFIVPQGSYVVTEDGRVISTTQSQRNTRILPDDKS